MGDVKMERIEYLVGEFYAPLYVTEEHGEQIENSPYMVAILEAQTNRPVHYWTGNDRVLAGHIQPRSGVRTTREMLFERLYSWGWQCLHGTLVVPDGAIIPAPIAKSLGRIQGKKFNDFFLFKGDPLHHHSVKMMTGGETIFPFFFAPHILVVAEEKRLLDGAREREEYSEER